MTTLWQDFAELRSVVNTELALGRQRVLALEKGGASALGRLSTVETKVNQAQQAFTALAARVTALESAVAAIQTTQAGINAELAKLDPTYVPS